MAGGFNGTKQTIDLAAGQTLSILATGPLKAFEIYESAIKADGITANVPQGMICFLPNDGTVAGFTSPFEILPPTAAEAGAYPERLRIPEDAGFASHGQLGVVLGNGPNTPGAGIPAQPASTVAKVKTVTGAATSIVVTQWY